MLAAEKDFQKARDALAAKRRAMPRRRIETEYVFESESGPVTLAGLFGDRTQLIVYHFMYHPDWSEGCKSCSFWADGYDNSVAHLRARDVSLATVSRGPLDKLLAYRERMGWSFPWVSSAGNTFNYDFNVSFTQQQLDSGTANYNYRDGARVGEEMPGLSVFLRDEDDKVLHTYSTFARGLDPFNPTYQLLDLVPKGRDESGLPYPMDWLRRHDDY